MLFNKKKILDAPRGDQTVTTSALRPGWFPHLDSEGAAPDGAATFYAQLGKHITAHNAGPWARTGVRTVPFESSQQDLTSYRGARLWEGQQRVVMRGQRYKMMKSHGPGDILAHNSGPWPRRWTRIGPSELSLIHI